MATSPLRKGPSGPITSAPAGGSAIIQVGWDIPDGEITVPAQTEGSAPFPRSNEDDVLLPLQVAFPSASRGNYIECAWNATLANEDTNTADFSAVPIISFVENPTFPGDFFIMASGMGGSTIPGVESGQDTGCSSGRVTVQIPEGEGSTVPVTVQLAYHSTGDFTVGGVTLTDDGPGATLTIKEWGDSFVTQPGPGVLVPLGS